MMKLQNYRKVYMCKNYSLAIFNQYKSFKKNHLFETYRKKNHRDNKISKNVEYICKYT